MTEKLKDAWDEHAKLARQSVSQHAIFHFSEKVETEAFSTDFLFGQFGRAREREIAEEFELLKQQYYSDRHEGPSASGLDWATKELSTMLSAALINSCRFKFLRCKEVLQFPTRYSDALDGNEPLNKRMRQISRFIFSEQSINTPVCLYYEHLDGGPPGSTRPFTSF